MTVNPLPFEELMKVQSPAQWAEDLKSLAARSMLVRDKSLTYEQQIEQNKRILNAICIFCQAGAAQSV